VDEKPEGLASGTILGYREIIAVQQCAPIASTSEGEDGVNLDRQGGLM
jgi:hypothetical protein